MKPIFKKAAANNSREQMLNAAEDVVIESGVNGMTLEAVAARAGVSKGGLLYHFPSKDELIKAMVSRIASVVSNRFAEELAVEPPGRGRHARTLLRVMLNGHGSTFARLKRVAAPLLAAMASDPRLLGPMRQFFKRVHQGMLDDGMPDDSSLLVLAALDGLKYWRIFGLLEPSETDLVKLRRLLTQIIDQGSK